MTPLAVFGLSGAEVAAWIAAIAGLSALIKQGYDAFKKRKTEKTEIEEALDKSPQVRHQLELGNIGEAVKHLNTIIQTQEAHNQTLSTRITEGENYRIELQNRNNALEAEIDSWRDRHEEMERLRKADKDLADRRISELQAELEETKRTFARTLSQVRAEYEPGEMT